MIGDGATDLEVRKVLHHLALFEHSPPPQLPKKNLIPPMHIYIYLDAVNTYCKGELYCSILPYDLRKWFKCSVDCGVIVMQTILVYWL